MNQFLDFLEKIKMVGLEWYRRYYSSYLAVVVDNNDPEQRGRIKVKCPSVWGKDYINPSWIDPKNMDKCGKNSGKFNPPYIGQMVFLEFEFGDLRNPIYTGGYYGKDELAEEFKTSYPNIRGWAWKSGQRLLIDETDNAPKVTIKNADGSFIDMDGKSGSENIIIKHKSGATVVIDKNGDILLSDKDGKDSISVKSGLVEVVSNGNVSVNGKGDVTINGKSSASFSGNSSTSIGSSGSPTSVNGSSVAIAGGGKSVAAIGNQSIGYDSHGAPVLSKIIDGSSKVSVS